MDKMSADNQAIALPDAPGAIRKAVRKGTPVPTYWELYRQILDGKIDATRIGKRLFLTPETVRQIAHQAEKQ
jgi:hypothetical protein